VSINLFIRTWIPLKDHLCNIKIVFVTFYRERDVNVILNSPHFITKESLEPLYVPKSDILEESLKREIAKICYPENLINRVIYDSVTESFYHKVIIDIYYSLIISNSKLIRNSLIWIFSLFIYPNPMMMIHWYLNRGLNLEISEGQYICKPIFIPKTAL